MPGAWDLEVGLLSRRAGGIMRGNRRVRGESASPVHHTGRKIH
jgi:hypothetical protein